MENAITEQKAISNPIYESLLKLYVSEDRENLIKPFVVAHHVTSTTSYDGVWIPEDYIEEQNLSSYKKTLSPYSFLKAAPFNPATGKPISTNSSFVLTKSKIIESLSNVPQKEDVDEIEIDCSNCNGTGSVECDLGHEHDCDRDGCFEGKIKEEKPNGKMVDDFSKYVLCNGMGIGIKRLQSLLKVMEITGRDSCVHILSSPNSCNLFDFKDFIIYVMPMMREDGSLDNIYHEIK